jgi:hypothetical protein
VTEDAIIEVRIEIGSEREDLPSRRVTYVLAQGTVVFCSWHWFCESTFGFDVTSSTQSLGTSAALFNEGDSSGMKLYRYVGPKQIAERVRAEPAGVSIRSTADVLAWVRNSDQQLLGGHVIATFVIDATGVLLVADRRSEHVVCARGGLVQSAGEITFAIDRDVEIVAVSNQSTGYCPEPESWMTVAEALLAAGMKPPAGFDLACNFRRCIRCSGLTLVKDEAFECAECGAELPAAYNCQIPDVKLETEPDHDDK